MERTKLFSGEKYVVLESYRKTGEGVQTTVWLVADGGLVYIRTDPRSGKVKRISRNPHVRIAAANMRGLVSGDWVDGEARLVEGEESERILELFRKKYGLQYRLLMGMGRLRRFPPLQVISIALRESIPHPQPVPA